MRQVCVKPISFKYFHNSKTYYLNGSVLQPIFEDNSIILPRGSLIQLTFDSLVLGATDLQNSRSLIFTVEPLAQEVYSCGRNVLRFSVAEINENNQRNSD